MLSSKLKYNRSVRTDGLPCWLSGKEVTCQCRRHGFDPWSGKISHAMKQLSPWTTSIEPVLWSLWAAISESTYCSYWSPNILEPVLCNKRSHSNKKFVCHNQRKACASTKTQHSQIKLFLKKYTTDDSKDMSIFIKLTSLS